MKSLFSTLSCQVDPFCSVSAAHDIGENVRHQIHESHPEVAEVFIHIGKNIPWGLEKLKRSFIRREENLIF